MKNLFYLFLMLSFFLFSCGGSSEKTTGDGDEAVQTEQSSEIDDGDLTIKDCDDFLDKYDEWTDEYLKVLKAWKEDPTNVEVSQSYMELTQSMTTWYTEWTDYVQCAAQEKYQKRFEEIAEKIDKGIEELGLDE